MFAWGVFWDFHILMQLGCTGMIHSTWRRKKIRGEISNFVSTSETKTQRMWKERSPSASIWIAWEIKATSCSSLGKLTICRCDCAYKSRSLNKQSMGGGRWKATFAACQSRESSYYIFYCVVIRYLENIYSLKKFQTRSGCPRQSCHGQTATCLRKQKWKSETDREKGRRLEMRNNWLKWAWTSFDWLESWD